MHLSRITLHAPEAATAGSVPLAIIVDLVWAAAVPADRVEHVELADAHSAVEVGIFARAESPEAARLSAHRLVCRCRDMSPLLRGWRVEFPAVAATLQFPAPPRRCTEGAGD